MNLLATGDEGILNIIPEPLTLRNSINDVNNTAQYILLNTLHVSR